MRKLELIKRILKAIPLALSSYYSFWVPALIFYYIGLGEFATFFLSFLIVWNLNSYYKKKERVACADFPDVRYVLQKLAEEELARRKEERLAEKANKKNRKKTKQGNPNKAVA